MLRALASTIMTVSFLLVVFGGMAFELRNGNYPGAGMALSSEWGGYRNGRVTKGIEQRLVARSKLDDALRPWYSRLMFESTGITSIGVEVGPRDWLFPTSRLRPLTEAQRDQLPETLRLISEVVRWFESHGTYVVIELVPRKHTLYPEEVPERIDPSHTENFDLVRHGLLALGLEVPDLRPALHRPLVAGAPPFYFTNDDHWNGDGCHAAAKVIADSIRRNVPEGTDLGPRLESEFAHQGPREFIGSAQRMLGFEPGTRAFDRFTTQHERFYAVDPDTKEPRLGASEPRPVLVLGTSFSGPRYSTPSQLIGLLERDVHSHCFQGFASGYRLLEIGQEFALGRWPVPRVLVWEFPEDLPLREGAYFRQPIEDFLALVQAGKWQAAPFPPAERTSAAMEIRHDQKGVLGGVPEGSNAYVRYRLKSPLKADCLTALSYNLNIYGARRGSGEHVVEWWGGGELLGSRRRAMREGHRLHPVVTLLTSPQGASIDEIRIYPHTGLFPWIMDKLALYRRQP